MVSQANRASKVSSAVTQEQKMETETMFYGVPDEVKKTGVIGTTASGKSFRISVTFEGFGKRNFGGFKTLEAVRAWARDSGVEVL